MPIPEWIGISGPIGSGKSTLAQIINKALYDIDPERFVLILPITFKIKEVARSLGWNGEKDEKGRRLLQLLGTEVGRECIGERVWIDNWFNEALKWWRLVGGPSKCTVIADDIRFPNEAEYILSLGGSVIKVLPSFLGYEKYPTDHKTEASLPETCITKVVHNNGGLRYFEEHTRLYIFDQWGKD